MCGVFNCFEIRRAAHFTVIGKLVFALAVITLFMPSAPANAQYSGGFYFKKFKYKKKYTSDTQKKRTYKKQRRTNTKVDRSKSFANFKTDEGNKDPVQIIVSLPSQRARIFQGTKLIASTPVSTGKPGHSTPAGIYSIIQKNRRHYSNLYGGAPMPYMQRITWSGIALHAGIVPRYPASHGCIRLPNSFARKLFGFTKMGAHVVITRDNNQPVPISHTNLFQPIPSKHAEEEETAELTNDPEVRTITSSTTVETAAAVPNLDDEGANNEVPSHVMRLGGLQRVAAVQRLLNFLGFDAGRPDGDVGWGTRSAILKFQKANDFRPTGTITDELFTALYLQAGREDIALGRNPNNPEHAKALAKPVRILITRRTKMEKVRDVQNILRFLGYYKGYADGHVGRGTRSALKKFQYDFYLKQTGTMSEETVDKLYEHANWGEPATGHIYVRQDFKDIYDSPMIIRDIDKPLGSHLYTAMHFEDNDSKTSWLSMTLPSRAQKAKKRWNRYTKKNEIVQPAVEASTTTASEALDRVELTDEIKKKVGELLTPGSSLIIADGGWTRETGNGTDFIVQAR